MGPAGRLVVIASHRSDAARQALSSVMTTAVCCSDDSYTRRFFALGLEYVARAVADAMAGRVERAQLASNHAERAVRTNSHR